MRRNNQCLSSQSSGMPGFHSKSFPPHLPLCSARSHVHISGEQSTLSRRVSINKNTLAILARSGCCHGYSRNLTWGITLLTFKCKRVNTLFNNDWCFIIREITDLSLSLYVFEVFLWRCVLFHLNDLIKSCHKDPCGSDIVDRGPRQNV